MPADYRSANPANWWGSKTIQNQMDDGDNGGDVFDINTNAYTGGSDVPNYSPDLNYFDPMQTPYGSVGYDTSILGDSSNWGSNGNYFGDSGAYSGMADGNSFYTGNVDIGPRDTNSSLEELRRITKNPIVSMLMSLHPATNIARAAIQGPKSIGGFLGAMLGSSAGPLGSMLGRAAGSGIGNMISTGNTSASNFLPSAGQTGGFLGSMFGSASGSPYGGLLGGLAGSAAGNWLSQNAGSSGGSRGAGFGTGDFNGNSTDYNGAQQFAGGSSGLNDGLLGLLPSLYAGGRQNNEIKGQINNLNQLFSPNSAYAQQMRQQLERRDAAAGRRSQYGNREVELQAKLATLAAAQAPMIDKLSQQRQGNRNLLIQTALRNPGVQDLIRKGGMSLLDLFNTPTLGLDNSPYSNFDSSTLPNLLGETGGWFGGTGGDSPDWGF